MRKEKILEQRTDVSRYLLHWTTRERFRGIVRGGFLVATYAPREISPEETFNTIRGNKKAVCFTEMPIGNYLQSAVADPSRYKLWGIAILKKTLYAYGGRPVLYSDESFYRYLKSIKPENEGDKYRFLFSNYSPIGGGADWMHEREWRVCPNIEINSRIGLNADSRIHHFSDGKETELKGDCLVPLHLPAPDKRGKLHSQLPKAPEFVLLVETKKDAEVVNRECKQEIDILSRSKF
jgi:hypothetical protein